ncbi:MAG: hypothetical protein IPM98_20260 [Lewinellaceae bacterium]|nr:hypothetical protein [Lewinellaceae bacterium]
MATDCGFSSTCSRTITWTEDAADPQFNNCPQTPIDLDCNPANLPDEAAAIAAAGAPPTTVAHLRSVPLETISRSTAVPTHRSGP